MSDSNFEAYRYAISKHESGHNYGAVNKSSGALGRYQVMPFNVASWTKEALGESMTPEQFLKSPDAQDKVFDKIFGGYVSKYGPDGAAATWFSGSPNVKSSASDGNNTVPQYLSAFRSGVGEFTGQPYDVANAGSPSAAPVEAPAEPVENPLIALINASGAQDEQRTAQLSSMEEPAAQTGGQTIRSMIEEAMRGPSEVQTQQLQPQAFRPQQAPVNLASLAPKSSGPMSSPIKPGPGGIAGMTGMTPKPAGIASMLGFDQNDPRMKALMEEISKRGGVDG